MFKFFNFFLIALLISLISLGCSLKQSEVGSDAKSVRAPGVVISTEERSPIIPYAKAILTFPNQKEILEDGDVYVVVKADSFELGALTLTNRSSEIANSDKGQHIHLILDNTAYKAIYEADKPINLGRLSPGPHTVFVFPSRSYHESVKTPEASDILNFYVLDDSGEFELTKDSKSIIYSRPKGEYKGSAAKKIMLDFYLNNVELSSDGYRAKYTISKRNETGGISKTYNIILDEWKPAFVSGLSSGKYSIILELIDGNGDLVPGAYNKTEREIIVNTDIE